MNGIKDKNGWLDNQLNQLYCRVIDDLTKRGKMSTCQNYQYSLSVFYAFLISVGGKSIKGLSVRYFTVEILGNFYQWLLQGRKVSSATTVFANIRGLLKRISEQDPTFKNLYNNALEIKTCSKRNRYSEILDDDECRALIDAPGRDSKTGIKYTCIFSLLLTSGFRISEELSIRLRDMHLAEKNSFVIVEGKGKRKREVPIADNVVPLIVEYIVKWHGDNPDPNAFLFYSPIFGFFVPASRASVQKQLKKYLISTFGVEKAEMIHLHLLRHTAATKWFENNVNYPQVSKMLGHANLKITRTYVKISRSKMLEELKKASFGCDTQKPKVKLEKAKEKESWLDAVFANLKGK